MVAFSAVIIAFGLIYSISIYIGYIYSKRFHIANDFRKGECVEIGTKKHQLRSDVFVGLQLVFLLIIVLIGNIHE